MSRLVIEIEPEEHRQIKSLATFEGLTIKEFILRRTIRINGNEQDTTEKLLSHPVNAQRIQDALEEPRSQRKTFATIEDLEDLEDALGI